MSTSGGTRRSSSSSASRQTGAAQTSAYSQARSLLPAARAQRVFERMVENLHRAQDNPQLRADVPRWSMATRAAREARDRLLSTVPDIPGKGANRLDFFEDESKLNAHLMLGAHANAESIARLVGATPRQTITVIATRSDRMNLTTTFHGKTQTDVTLMRASAAHMPFLPRASLVAEVPQTRSTEKTASSGRTMLDALAAMRQIGVRMVTMSAARGTTLNGYDTWAKLGADGKTPDDVANEAARHFGVAKSAVAHVQDIMRMPGGPAWWRKNGDTFSGHMDLRPGGRTAAILDYLASRAARNKGG